MTRLFQLLPRLLTEEKKDISILCLRILKKTQKYIPVIRYNFIFIKIMVREKLEKTPGKPGKVREF